LVAMPIGLSKLPKAMLKSNGSAESKNWFFIKFKCDIEHISLLYCFENSILNGHIKLWQEF
jgi:hypothetical protein